MNIKKLARQPMLHFFAFGLLAFIIDSSIGEAPNSEGDRIFISMSEQKSIKGLFKQSWHREPTSEEFKKLLENQILQDRLYNEALYLGLDKDDVIVKRRMAQKLESIIASQADFITPTSQEIETYYQQNIERYNPETLYTFEQHFVDKKISLAVLENIHNQLRTTGKASQSPTMLPLKMKEASQRSVEKTFGTEFFSVLSQLQLNQWSEPIETPFGYHFVKVIGRDIQPESLKDVRNRVSNDFTEEAKEKKLSLYYHELAQKYPVVVER